jgi:sugar/nucleoside kinase (ribokinase family)
MFDVIALGELLIDFAPQKEAWVYKANPGGAPANVAVALARLGLRTAFVGKVGRDAFGNYLKSTLEAEGVDTRGLVQTREAPTTLAFVSLDERGDRDFTFYRRHSADTLLQVTDLDEAMFEDLKVFHCGSLSLTHDSAKKATFRAIDLAKARGARISYDPNYRGLLWESEAKAVKAMKSILPQTDILKISEEELSLITGEGELDRGLSHLTTYDIDIVVVTRGAAGAVLCHRGRTSRIPAYPVVAVDTTGSGDAFMGALLYRLITGKDQSLEEAVRFANAAGGLCATKSGAIPALGDERAIRALMAGK